jgi:hypothetical protein
MLRANCIGGSEAIDLLGRGRAAGSLSAHRRTVYRTKVALPSLTTTPLVSRTTKTK